MKIAGIVIGLAVVVAVGIGFMSYVGAYNYGNETEQKIIAVYDNNQNILAQYGQKVIEAAQVPAMARDDIAAIVKEAMLGRYGADGSQAIFQSITEAYPGQVDPTLYTQIQRIIESGRNEFATAQTQLIDVKRQYSTELGSFWRGMWMKMAGYPKIDLNDYGFVTTTRASEAFETGTEGPIVLRP